MYENRGRGWWPCDPPKERGGKGAYGLKGVRVAEDTYKYADPCPSPYMRRVIEMLRNTPGISHQKKPTT